jgi:hypothetical protein
VRAGVVHENTAHDARRDREEMFPVPAAAHRFALHFQIGLVHQSRGLQGVPRRLASQLRARDGPQLRVERLGDGVERGCLAILPGAQQRRYGWACIVHRVIKQFSIGGDGAFPHRP